MKKTGILILAAAVFLAAAAAGGAYLTLSPRGALRAVGPEEAVQAELEQRSADWWREAFIRLCAPETTAFEDPAAVAGALFDAAVEGRDFSFREETPGGRREVCFILSAGEADLLRLRARFEDGGWQVQPERLDALQPERRTLTVTVPEDARVLLNGQVLGDEYRREIVDYEDMSPLELRFAAPPRQAVYAVEGICLDARVEAERPEGAVLLQSDGSHWRFTVPDAGGYSFLISAPTEAAVTVNGALLTPEDVTATGTYHTKLSIPEELQDKLPSYVYYAAGGLYSRPEISAKMPDGAVLEPQEGQDGSVRFSVPFSPELKEAVGERVGAFLYQMCEYSAGHTGRNDPGSFAVSGGGVQRYFYNARASLQWTYNVQVSYQSRDSFDYLPLGEDAFLCRGRVECTTTTYYQTKELALEYEMLWIRENGVWLVEDMAYLT